MTNQLGIRVGFAGGTTLRTIDAVREDLRFAENAGFDSYWVSFVVGVDPLVALAVVADDAPAIAEVGTSVVPFPGRHPIALAQLARTTQQACAGRFTLGVGPSHQVVVEGMYGQPWAGPMQRTTEYLQALVPLCNGEAVSFTGEQLAATTALDIPCDPVPVVLAALGPRMLDLAGRVTAGTHVGQCGPRTVGEHIVPSINAAAAGAGRAAPRTIALINICVTDDPAAARAAAAEGMAGYAALPSYRAMLDREGITDPTDLILAGSIDEIVAGFAAYAAAGATDLRIGIAAPDQAQADATRQELARWLN